MDEYLREGISPPKSAYLVPRKSDVSETPAVEYHDNVLTWFKKRNGTTLQGALAFVPWVLQQSYFVGGLEDGRIEIHRGQGAVVFSDASGFTALTERLAKKSNGAELLSQCLSAFFTPLINFINAYRGDVIKFSGDALTIYFPAVDDTTSSLYNNVVPPHGSYGLPDIGPMATAVLRSSACCIEIHKRLHMFDTGVGNVKLCLHIGVGCGEVSILQVGGVVPPETKVGRCEYFIAGPPIEQISIAEPLAKTGETCLSPQAWDLVKDCVIEGNPLEDRPDYHLLLKLNESKYTFPTVKHAAMENDTRREYQFRLAELNVIRRFIPSAVFKQIECGTLTYVNEMRNVSTIFINGPALDVMTTDGAQRTQQLMTDVQCACYAHEGTLNKFLIDDKGMLFLLVWGLPPLVHTDDPTRAVLCCFDMVKVFRKLQVGGGKFGVTTGRSYCGVCGSESRMEYTVLGDCVNLSARLMAHAPPLGILVDEATKNRGTSEILFNALPPIKVKGKGNPIPVYSPVLAEPPAHIGLTPDRRIRFPWYDHPFGGALASSQGDVTTMQQNLQQLCCMKSWAGIIKVQEMLGGSFNDAVYQKDLFVSWSPVSKSAPSGSPFAEGGIVLMEGPTGTGKIELAEHIVSFCALNFQMMPIFGTMGPRPGDSTRLVVELLRSMLAVFRHLNSSVPPDDYLALAQVVPKEHSATLPDFRQALRRQSGNDNNVAPTLSARALPVVLALLQVLKRQTSVLVVLQFEYGTSLFPEKCEDQREFWDAVAMITDQELPEMGKKSSNQKTLAMMIICKEADMWSPAVKHAIDNNSFIQLSGLTEENTFEYMGHYIGVPEVALPPALRQFVAKVTMGNPLHIRETIGQLFKNQHISLEHHPPSLECKDLKKINIANWQQTAMVGGTICLLESLDPLEAAVLKMSTCFTGPFTLPDLAASTCSRWADATHFDNLRLFNSVRKLIRLSILEEVAAPESSREGEVGRSASWVPSNFFGNTQYFQMNNVLIRAVGSAMVLEAQKKAVKRQALIERALGMQLPKRMEELAIKRSAQHVPWYYEQAFRRMK